MKFNLIVRDAVESSEAVLNCTDRILAAEEYCAKAEIYCEYLRQNREKAELYKNNFREFNDKIFSLSMDILDAAIKEANTELAECALKTVETMRSTYPDFYSKYLHQLFGR